MKKVLIIGAGGVGSVLAEHLHKATDTAQISDEITIADFDSVEAKNMQYQNFGEEDLLYNKAVALAKRYPTLKALPERVKESTLSNYDIFVLAVDDFNTRAMVYQYCYKADKHFIDLRAEGRWVVALAKGRGLDADLETLGTGGEAGSCQRQCDIDNGIIQYGNLIAASLGIQLLVNYLRDNRETGNKIIMRV
jgi:molybdopterin/thiamine biosynthesis adenylyltransferase